MYDEGASFIDHSGVQTITHIHDPPSMPSIAQLVERWTVVVKWQSIGHWFESGSKETVLCQY